MTSLASKDAISRFRVTSLGFRIDTLKCLSQDSHLTPHFVSVHVTIVSDCFQGKRVRSSYMYPLKSREISMLSSWTLLKVQFPGNFSYKPD